nr:hypothetical protein Iba_chr01bCG12410 [Ipomoea batatas]
MSVSFISEEFEKSMVRNWQPDRRNCTQDDSKGLSRITQVLSRSHPDIIPGFGGDLVPCVVERKKRWKRYDERSTSRKTDLAVAIGLIVDNAARGTLSAFDKRGINVVLYLVNRNVNNRPLIST